jgi:hypothetical protein
MISEGQIVLFRFPKTDQTIGKLRPALVLRRLPGQHHDWLICMISSNLKKGYISNPKGKAKSVGMTEEGFLKSKELFEQHFAKEK